MCDLDLHIESICGVSNMHILRTVILMILIMQTMCRCNLYDVTREGLIRILVMEDVESERLPLINASTANSRRNWCWKLKSRYSQSFVTSGPAILCLVWMGIITSL